MSRTCTAWLVPITLVICMAWTAGAEARRSYLGDIPNGSQARCAACHLDGGSGPRNAFGDSYTAAGGAWSALYALDSDGDGESNGLELGDPCGVWVPGSAPARGDMLSNPGLASSTSSVPMPDCGGVAMDAGVGPADAGGGHITASTPLPSEYPDTRVSGGCSVSGGYPSSEPLTHGSAPPFAQAFWLALSLCGLLSRRSRSSVAAAAATAGEAPGGALPHLEGVPLGAADLGVSINRHVPACERRPLIGCDRYTSSADCPAEKDVKQRVRHGAHVSNNSMMGTIYKCVWMSFTACAILFASGCISQEPTFIPLPSRPIFDAEVMPVLARDCAFPACHGDTNRFFVVYAPGRTRRDPVTDPWAPLTADEGEANYQRALSMLVGANDAEHTLLVETPLSTAAGGSFHRGVDGRGLDVYSSRDDAGYRVLLAWARAALAGEP